MKTLIILTVIILASGCAKSIPVQARLNNPPLLELPKISGLECLTDESYSNLVKRDKLQTARRMTLRAIIDSTK